MQFAVSESGAATISIPIQVPRGIGGMEPQLSLDYSSQGGNGLLGIGWSLSGVSAVTRCPKTMTPDGVRGSVNFNSDDRFCLDGQRLLVTNAVGDRVDQSGYGAPGVVEYRTERDGFSRIRSYRSGSTGAAPEAFRAWTKAGLIIDYGLAFNGKTADAVPMGGNAASGLVMTNFVNGAANTVNRWMVKRIWDRNGNYIEFTYCHGKVDVAFPTHCDISKFNGSSVLLSIQYTNRSVTVADGKFGVYVRYEDRPDTVPGFHAGSRSVQTQRIKRIETYYDWASVSAPGVLVRRYELTYEPLVNGNVSLRATNASRLASVQEFDASGNSMNPIALTMVPDRVFGMTVMHSFDYTAGTFPSDPDLQCGGTTRRICP